MDSMQHSKMQRNRNYDMIDDELQLPTRDTIYDRIYDVAERCASTRIGQYIIERADRVLKMVENTAKWSLPLDRDEVKRERPLSWGPFLTMIVVLRLIRMWLSVAALMIGNAPVMPRDMVQFIQIRRRKLHAMRSRGLTVMRRREVESKTKKSYGNEMGYIGQLRSLLSCAICRPGLHRESVKRIYIQDGKEYVVEEQILSPSDLTNNTHEDSSEDNGARERKKVSTNDLLNMYAEESSEEDLDFLAESEATIDDTTTSNASNTSSDSSTNLIEELHALKADLKSDACLIMQEPISLNETENNDAASVTTKNGPSNGGGESRDVVTTLSMAKIYSEEKQKTTLTPEELNTAPRRNMPIVGNAATAANIETQKTEDTLVISPVNDCSLVDLDGSDISNAPLLLNIKSSTESNSSSASSASSSSTATSIVINEEFLFNAVHSEPSTPTSPNPPTPLEQSSLSSASSTDDVFYSPFGSPPDFNASLGATQAIINPNTNQGNVISTSNIQGSSSNIGENIPQQQNRYQRQQQNHHQRFRPKNRR